jgi:hypothetical protein
MKLVEKINYMSLRGLFLYFLFFILISSSLKCLHKGRTGGTILNTFLPYMRNGPIRNERVLTFQEFKWLFVSKRLNVNNNYQIEEIYDYFKRKGENDLSKMSLISAIEYFIKPFDKCDKNKDNLLSNEEFKNCINKDKHLSFLQLLNTGKQYFPTFPKYDILKIFLRGIDTASNGNKNSSEHFNFYHYMELRLISFSLRKCGDLHFFVSRNIFNCSLNYIVQRGRSIPQTTAKRVFELGRELSNIRSHRNLDIVTFLILVRDIKLFTKVNRKNNNKVDTGELISAVRNGILPMFYNNKIIEMITLLTNNSKHGIDLYTFVFTNYFLRVFYQNTNCMSLEDFMNILNDPLTPRKIVKFIAESENTSFDGKIDKMYMTANLSQAFSEADFFMKNFRFSQNKDESSVIEAFFNLMSLSNKKCVAFDEFMYLIQVCNIFRKKAKNTTPALLYETFRTYSDYPAISSKIFNNIDNFKLIPSHFNLNLFTTYSLLKKSDTLKQVQPKNFHDTMDEITLKSILSKMNIKNINDGILDKCLTGERKRNLPLYSFDCALKKSLTTALDYHRTRNIYSLAKRNNLNLKTISFHNYNSFR